MAVGVSQLPSPCQATGTWDMLTRPMSRSEAGGGSRLARSVEAGACPDSLQSPLWPGECGCEVPEA